MCVVLGVWEAGYVHMSAGTCRGQKRVGSSGVGHAGDCERLCVGELSLVPLEEQEMLLAPVPYSDTWDDRCALLLPPSWAIPSTCLSTLPGP